VSSTGLAAEKMSSMQQDRSTHTQSQHGLPSVCAAVFWKISLIAGHALSEPPGMSDGPCRAPSSPPETPEPTNSRPFFSSSAVRRFESG